jgi:hypothetical protein
VPDAEVIESDLAPEVTHALGKSPAALRLPATAVSVISNTSPNRSLLDQDCLRDPLYLSPTLRYTSIERRPPVAARPAPSTA